MDPGTLAEAVRARVAAEAVGAAAAAAAAAERSQLERKLAVLARSVSEMLRMQQVQAQLGVAPPPAPHCEEVLCVVCMDAPNNHVVLPCLHMCVCEACAEQLLQLLGTSRCPVCRTTIERIGQVFT